MQKIIIIGGGVAGITAAINAKQTDNEVIVLEKNKTCLKKLLLTGNGHCNYYNDDFNYTHYITNDNNLLKNVINDQSKIMIEDFYNKIGLVPKVKNGYYYPQSNQSYSFFNAILKEAAIRGVNIQNEVNVLKINKGNNFKVVTDKETYECDKLIIATGSKAYPKTGSTGDSYIFASSLGHSVNKVYPALVQLTSDNKILKELDGVRVDAKVILLKDNNILKEEIGELQFTNYGLSGICIYNLSLLVGRWLKKGNLEVSVNLLNVLDIDNENDVLNYLNNKSNILPNRSVGEILEQILNYKIVNAIFKILKLNNNIQYYEMSEKQKNVLAKMLIDFRFNINGTKDYNNSQVCCGGIPLKEINDDFSSKLVDNLYLVGELVDITGECGGYNISFAILSGIKAGISAGGKK